MTRSFPIALALLLTACSDEPVGPEQPTSNELFGSDFTQVVVEVDYADGAEPNTGGGVAADDPWQLLERNLDALFDGTKQLTVPHALDEMEPIGAIEGESFDSAALLELAEAHRNRLSGDGVAGYKESDGGAEAARWNAPWGVALDLTGDLLVCDSQNHCVRKARAGCFGCFE